MKAKILVSTIPSTTWTNVFHFTKKDNKANYGDRLPAVWIHKSGFFHICSAVSGNKNFCKNKPFQRNRLYSIRIQQAKNGDYSINVDGIELYKGKNTTPKDFNNVKVYTSDPWYEPFTTKYGILKDFRFWRGGIGGNCYIDNPKRILDPKTKIALSIMTPDVCNKICVASNYKYFGVEYGAECFCGNKLPSRKLKDNMSKCNMNCRGDTKQKCGASWRINISKTKRMYKEFWQF